MINALERADLDDDRVEEALQAPTVKPSSASSPS